MEDEGVVSGANAAADSHGRYVAFARDHLLVRKHVLSRREEQVTALPPQIASTITDIKWSKDASQILFIHNAGILVVDSNSQGERVRIQNGSGSLGIISSADFIGTHHLLVTWEFGRTKLFHMNSGKSLDLAEMKPSCNGKAWQIRPGRATPPLFALLSRTPANDQLNLHFSSLEQALPPVKLPTLDAQSLSWSPNGRWLAILDVPTANSNVYIYTPDGHLFRSYPSTKDNELGLGVKCVTWSASGSILALAKHDGRVELLNTRTFTPVAIIAHCTTINQAALPPPDRAPIWLENVSASGERSYAPQTQPVSPPLSKLKSDLEPKDLGVAELAFSCDGQYLATRDCRMLNTVWLWDMSTLAPCSVLIQHANVRSLQWHPTRPNTLLIDCAEGFAHIFNISPDTASPPIIIPTGMRPKATLSWLSTPASAKPTILVTEKTRFHTVFPEGRDQVNNSATLDEPVHDSQPFEEGASEDSLFEVLSGRKPLPPKTQQSYTEMVDLDVEAEEADGALEGAALDDTFREKRRTMVHTRRSENAMEEDMEVDPFDDSQIF